MYAELLYLSVFLVGQNYCNYKYSCSFVPVLIVFTKINTILDTAHAEN